MKQQHIFFAILITMLSAMFFSCEGVATLFHGPKPEETFTVTFNANGANGTPPEAQIVNEGSVISLPDKGNLTSAGNVFVGWNESLSGAGTTYSIGSSITVTKDMIFYAQWLDGSTPQYKVTFNANGATSGAAPAAQTAYSGSSITIPGQGTLGYTGKTFGGWNTQSNGGGTNYEAGAAYNVTGNVTLYAKWQSVVQYTVTYSANSASGTAPAAQTVDPNTEVTVPDQGNLTVQGKKFAGWNTQSNGGGTNYTAGETFIVTGNITLYAKWQDMVTVTFNANGASGTAPTAQTVDPGTVINLPGVGSMSNTGKIFKGWNTAANGSGTGYEEGDTYAVSANATLYAQWEAVPIVPQGNTLAQQLAWIGTQGGNGVVYDIVVDNNENLGPTSVISMGVNITVNIRSASSSDVKTIQLEGQGHLFSIDTGITIRLQDIVLRGHSTNNRAVISLGNGTLILNSGSKITGNSNQSTNGGGILVSGGSLVMNDGSEISRNNAGGDWNRGGAIYVNNRGTVTINGGTITENNVGKEWCEGIAMFITGNSTVTMSGGIISKNITTHNYSWGGIFIASGSTFTKRAVSGSNVSGIIYGNNAGDNSNTNALRRGSGSPRDRNTTLGPGDEITTQSDVGWE